MPAGGVLASGAPPGPRSSPSELPARPVLDPITQSVSHSCRYICVFGSALTVIVIDGSTEQCVDVSQIMCR